jgi:ORF6C domain
MNKKYEVLNGGLPDLQKDERDLFIQQLLHQSLREMQSKVESVVIEQESIKEDVTQVKESLKRKTIDYGQQQVLCNAKNKRVERLWKDGDVNKLIHDTKRKLHAKAWKDLKDAFGVASYRDIKEKDFDEALNYIKSWRPRMV